MNDQNGLTFLHWGLAALLVSAHSLLHCSGFPVLKGHKTAYSVLSFLQALINRNLNETLWNLSAALGESEAEPAGVRKHPALEEGVELGVRGKGQKKKTPTPINDNEE